MTLSMLGKMKNLNIHQEVAQMRLKESGSSTWMPYEEVFKTLMEIECPELKLSKKRSSYQVLGLYPHAVYCLKYFIPSIRTIVPGEFSKILSIENLHKWHYSILLEGLILYHLSEGKTEMEYRDEYLDEVSRLTLASFKRCLHSLRDRVAKSILEDLKNRGWIDSYEVKSRSQGKYLLNLRRFDVQDRIQQIIKDLMVKDYEYLKQSIRNLEEHLSESEMNVIMRSVEDLLDKSQSFTETLKDCYRSSISISLSKTSCLKSKKGQYEGPISLGLRLDYIEDVISDLELIKKKLLEKTKDFLLQMGRKLYYTLVVGVKKVFSPDSPYQPIGLLATLLIYYHPSLSMEMKWLHGKRVNDIITVCKILRERNFEELDMITSFVEGEQDGFFY